MKIDEKIVSYFESCDSPVDKEGYLYKKGEIKTSYQKRWCVLKGNLLFYKERPSDRDLIGVIVLEGCTVQLCESEEQFAFSLVWSDPGLRTYKFAAEDETSQESWIKALLSANHNYLALLVTDMENKYKDTLVTFSGERSSTFYQSTQTSALHSYPALAVVTGTSMSSNPVLHAPAVSPKTAGIRSPKLRHKGNANVLPISAPALPVGERSGICLGKEEFSKLHEDFGKEVKELIAEWSKQRRGGAAAQEENLIDFG
uniref:Sesquipedalian n=1 Tax=Monopterus albus TaxID=43700 RepID=A0A3Q3JC11_MONAL|nr:sesquipedalian-1-like [Monopterus albus]XP_020478988.1 sesquipedalian-1-like [Monopterus albus]XP_020478989.1 sesquipedalian-1-like [Monopterus albus]